MNTLQFSLGLKAFSPPPGSIRINIMHDDDDEPIQKQYSPAHQEKSIKVLNIIKDGYDTVSLITEQSGIGEKTVRRIVNDLLEERLITRVLCRARGGMQQFFPMRQV